MPIFRMLSLLFVLPPFMVLSPWARADTGTGARVEHTLSLIARRLDRYAQSLDARFGDKQLFVEQANSRVILGVKGLFQSIAENRVDYALRVKLRLPRFERRMHLFFSKDSGADGDLGDNSDFFGPRSGLDQTSNLGLQYFFRDEEWTNVSLRGGMKLRGTALHLFIGPRYRRTFEAGRWLGRFSEELLWHSDDGWQSDSRLTFERLLKEGLLFRVRGHGLWLESGDNGYEYTLGLELDQTLRNDKVIRYEWSNAFKSGISGQLDESRLRLRYRRPLWRNQLFGEIAPQLAFRNADDFHADWGIELKLELVID